MVGTSACMERITRFVDALPDVGKNLADFDPALTAALELEGRPHKGTGSAFGYQVIMLLGILAVGYLSRAGCGGRSIDVGQTAVQEQVRSTRWPWRQSVVASARAASRGCRPNCVRTHRPIWLSTPCTGCPNCRGSTNSRRVRSGLPIVVGHWCIGAFHRVRKLRARQISSAENKPTSLSAHTRKKPPGFTVPGFSSGALSGRPVDGGEAQRRRAYAPA